jgi:hypothetical protein
LPEPEGNAKEVRGLVTVIKIPPFLVGLLELLLGLSARFLVVNEIPLLETGPVMARKSKRQPHRDVSRRIS